MSTLKVSRHQTYFSSLSKYFGQKVQVYAICAEEYHVYDKKNPLFQRHFYHIIFEALFVN